jgi:hypothetical protein
VKIKRSAKDQKANHSARGQSGISKSKETANTLSLWGNDDSCFSGNVERPDSDIDRAVRSTKDYVIYN